MAWYELCKTYCISLYTTPTHGRQMITLYYPFIRDRCDASNMWKKKCFCLHAVENQSRLDVNTRNVLGNNSWSKSCKLWYIPYRLMSWYKACKYIHVCTNVRAYVCSGSCQSMRVPLAFRQSVYVMLLILINIISWPLCPAQIPICVRSNNCRWNVAIKWTISLSFLDTNRGVLSDLLFGKAGYRAGPT